MARTKDETIREITTEYLENIDVDNPPTPAIIQADILENLHTAFEIENANKNNRINFFMSNAFYEVP